MEIKVSNVEWDVEEYSKGEQADILSSIPESFILPVSDDLDYDEVEDVVSDEISDIWGYCHNGFEYEIIK